VNVIGIDPSLTGTGMASVDGDLSTITSKPHGDTLTDRHDRLLDIIADALPLRDDPVDLVVIEAPSLGQSRQGGTLDRNGLWWLLIHELHLAHHTVLDVPPATLKKYATGKGNATKPDMRMALFQRAGIDCRDDNQVDAWWLRALGHHVLGQPLVDLPKAHTAALDRLTRPAQAVA
jgi:Holliday junction resolvasome RuvABC endonuclease subunit